MLKVEKYKDLRDNIELKLGKKVIRGNDCRQLSNEITKITRRHISESTIKRFFGITKSPFKPAAYTLDTFVKYIGYENWEEYISQNNPGDKEQPENSWIKLKNQIQVITDYSLISLKLGTGYNPQKVIFRSFAKEWFENFSKSQKSATLFVSPVGWGKSINLIQLTEEYFMGKDAPCQDDIILLIDGGIFFNLFSKNINAEILNQFIDFKIHSGHENYFQNNPAQRKGRFWLIIDNVDEIFFGKEKYHMLLENVMRMIMAYDNGWYKMIFTCRPENLDVFSYLVNKHPVLKSSWYEVDFDSESYEQAVNIPQLSDDEIRQLSKKLNFNYKPLAKNKNLINLLRNPSVLSLYNSICEINENVSEFDLIKKYLENKLHSPPYMDEKLDIIDSFVALCVENKTHMVNKAALLSEVKYLAAYHELISFGLLEEQIDSGGLFESKTFVQFRENLFLFYAMLEKRMQNTKPDIGLFYKIFHHFESNVQLQCDVLAFFIKYMIYRKEFDLIKQIESKIISKKILSLPENELCRKMILSVIKEDSLNVA